MGGPSSSTIDKQNQLSEEQLGISRQQNDRSAELFNLTMPGMKKATDYYSTLASGDPQAIQRAIAPATEQIAQQGAIAKQSIRDNTPRGGVERLAEAQTDASTAGQVGRLATQSYTGAFPALASLSGQGMGLSINQAANSISASNAAGNTLSNVGQEQAAGKASTMGMVSGLASAGGEMAMACWIAEKLYGVSDFRTHLLRHWLNLKWAKESRIGAAVMVLYRRYGQEVAAVVARNRAVRMLFGFLFNIALKRAERDFVEVA